MNFDNDEDLMKAIMGGGTGGGNVDDELAALEAEVGGGKGKGEDDALADLENELENEDKPKGKQKAKPKNDSDDELAALEKEGLDDEEEKPKPKPKVEQKPEVKKPQPKPQAPPQQKKEEVPKGPDLYPEKTEKKYHSVEKMTSLGVLEKEKEICNKIIEYKKKIGADYDDWDIKKESIDDKIGSVTSFIQDGIWDLDKYKKEIANQFKWEAKLLLFVEKDPTLNDEQKKILKDRVKARQSIIEDEIKQKPEEAEEEEKPKEESKKESKKETKKEEPKKEIIETKKSLSPMYSVPKEKEEEEKNRLNKVVIDRLNEYRAAIEYFQNNELGEQRIDANNKAKLICIELKRIQDGKWKEVNEFNLPDPVTPEYICGCKKEERLEKFKKVIMDYDRQRKEHVASMTAKIEAFKKIPPQKFKKIKDVATKDLNEMKAKKEKFDKIINLLKEKRQDSWVPAPLFIEQDKEFKTEVVNKDIPENTVRMIFGKTTYSKDKSLYLIVKHQEKNKETKFDQKGPGNWEHQIDWKYDKGEFKSFFRSKIHVEIWEKRFLLKDTLKGQFDMEPKGLKDHVEITEEFPINLESGRKEQTAVVTFKVHTPCKEPEYNVETKSFLQVTKIYPPFNLKGGNNNQAAIKIDVKPNQVSAQDLSVNNTQVGQNIKPTGGKPQAKPQAQRPKAAPGGKPAGVKKPGAPSAPIDKSQFKEEELNDPDCIDCLNTLQVLQFKQNKYEEIRNKIDGRTPRELMQRIIKIKCKIQSIENSLGDEISPQDYAALLKVTFEHDKKLLEYFKQTGDKEKYMLVNERVPLIVKELEELMKQMPK